jgi:hypothetical protein
VSMAGSIDLEEQQSVCEHGRKELLQECRPVYVTGFYGGLVTSRSLQEATMCCVSMQAEMGIQGVWRQQAICEHAGQRV